MGQVILWTREREDKLAELHPHYPTSKIGEMMGISKNAVIGKAARLGLPPRLMPPPRRARLKPKKKMVSIKPKPRPNGLALVPLIELKSNQCHWPFGDPQDADFGFCGQEIDGKHSSYCTEHKILGTIKTTKKRRVRG